eukprot:gnl/TRDRNA2_/TRDRNA2_37822_c0_seq1.p1 gnl/TRDRNA2_/TRDRNA2_37822_c0~~gnl/TRDRNA2_/TRDRNA2_37822_c0_seq1.p1  ORF type:complete len:479 (+),score=146.59 gnl/TRDRNA2_/TRDRNA2_37822_c0_seq1:126-1562(+)
MYMLTSFLVFTVAVGQPDEVVPSHHHHRHHFLHSMKQPMHHVHPFAAHHKKHSASLYDALHRVEERQLLDLDLDQDDAAPAQVSQNEASQPADAQDASSTRDAVASQDAAVAPGGAAPQDAGAVQDPAVSDITSETVHHFHPLTQNELRLEAKELETLEHRRENIEHTRREVAHDHEAATVHLPDAVSLQRKEVTAEAEVRLEEQKEQRISEEGLRLQKTRDELSERLHAVMDPKIRFAEQRLTKERALLVKAKEVAKRWEEEDKQKKAVAMASLKKKNAALAQVHESEKAMEEARRAHEAAEALYAEARTESARNVEAFRFTHSRFSGARGEVEEKTMAAEQGAESLKKMEGVLAMESKQVDAQLKAGEKRLEMKLEKAENVRELKVREVEKVSHELAQWKEAEHFRVKKAAEEKRAYDDNLRAYNRDRLNLYHGAEDLAGRKAERAGDWAWDDWAWSPSDAKVVSTGDTEEVHFRL